MENRLLARLSAVSVLSLTAAAMLLVSSLTVNAKKPPTASLSAQDRKIIEARARQVFRDDIIHGKGRDANDEDLKKWLWTFSDGHVLSINIIENIRAKLGNGFGAPEPSSAGVAYVLPASHGLREFRFAADSDSDWDLEDWIAVEDYEPRLRRRMDPDASGKISEDEFANYVTTFYDYIPVLVRHIIKPGSRD